MSHADLCPTSSPAALALIDRALRAQTAAERHAANIALLNERLPRLGPESADRARRTLAHLGAQLAAAGGDPGAIDPYLRGPERHAVVRPRILAALAIGPATVNALAEAIGVGARYMADQLEELELRALVRRGLRKTSGQLWERVA